MANALDLIRAAQLQETTVAVCLRLDLKARHEALLRELAETEKAQLIGASLRGNPRAIELAGQIVDLEAEMQESTVDFRIRALPRTQWAALVAKHPPRREDGRIVDTDIAGINADTFPVAMLRACIVAPVLGDEDFETFVNEKITDRQFHDLTAGGWEVNRGEVSVPFSHAASRIRQASASESTRPDSSASPSNGSKAGSQRKSRNTSATTKAS